MGDTVPYLVTVDIIPSPCSTLAEVILQHHVSFGSISVFYSRSTYVALKRFCSLSLVAVAPLSISLLARESLSIDVAFMLFMFISSLMVFISPYLLSVNS